MAAQLDDHCPAHLSHEQAVLEQQQALGRVESRAQQNFVPAPEEDAKSLGAQSRNASRDPSRENIGKRLNASKHSKHSQQQRERELKNIAEEMSEEARKLAKKISVEHFQQMCECKDTAKKTATSLRLSKQRFQQFLKGRFGVAFAEKIHNILDYTRAVDFGSYQAQVEMIVKDRNFMLQLAFDAFDANDDRKISQLDLFKTFKQFQKGAMANRFGEIFYHDVCQMSKKIS